MTNGNVSEYVERFKPAMEQRIELANVLIDLHMNAVLCDFGLASFVGGSPTSPGLATTSTRKGTPRYMSPELHFDDDCTHSLESDVWAWACTVFQVLTGSVPYAEALGEGQLCMAIFQQRPPGNVALVLPSNFEGTDSGSALALQFLHSVIPTCWDFDPQNRPTMSTLLSQISNLSFETVNVVGANTDGSFTGSQERATFLEASKRSLGAGANDDEVPRVENQCLLENIRLPRKGAEENVKFNDEQMERQRISNIDESNNNADVQGDTRNTLANAYPEKEKVAEGNVVVDQDEIAMKKGANSDEQTNEGQGVLHDRVANITSNHPSSNISTPTLGKIALGVASIIALSVTGYGWFRTSDFLPLPDALAIRPDHYSATQPFSTSMWPTACVVSLCANIYFVYFILRKVDSLTFRDQRKPATSKERQ
ncbi:hypothetical protein FS837_005835 [Tulasnella sp. UAMH 9824]|nr:hypothetical protein FS837_005835 [Tulasnella sp. UAMH 9824]